MFLLIYEVLLILVFPHGQYKGKVCVCVCVYIVYMVYMELYGEDLFYPN